MNSGEIRKKILEIGIVPVVRASSAALAARAAEAVASGGIPIIEITMTVPGAVALIAELAQNVGDDVIIGAGTVVNSEWAQQCVDAGAQFLVSPGLDEGMLQFALSKNILVIPGALTPTEIMAATAAGADLVKIFPCGAVGGAKYIKALRGPFPNVAMIPTGGVNLETAADFIRAGAVALGIGGELVSAAAIETANGSRISEMARKFLTIVQQAREEIATI